MSESNEVVSAVFNPFVLLSIDESNNEVAALSGRFNKSWKAQRNERIEAIVDEFNCSTADACFAVWLQDDARSIIGRERIKSAADGISDVLDEVTGKSSEIALQSIETIYSSVPAIDRPDVGRKVRDAAYKQFTGKMAGKLLDVVYAYLGVKESEWK